MGRHLSWALAGAVLVAAAAPGEAAVRQVSFDVDRQPGAGGVADLARQADIQILVSDSLIRGKTTRAVRGRMSVEEALRRLLAGTGLKAVAIDARTYTIIAAPPPRARPHPPKAKKPRPARPQREAPAPHSAEDASHGFEEIIVVGRSAEQDPTQMAPEAESLLHTAGDINDPLKALLNLPGIALAGADLDPPIMRGGGTRDNLFLVQDIPLPNLYHYLSDSFVNPNVVRRFDIASAALPLEYGDAIGGVIDVSLRDPIHRGVRGVLDFSELKSGGMIEGALTDDVAAYASYRVNVSHLFIADSLHNDLIRYEMPRSSDYTARVQWRGPGVDLSATLLGFRDERRNAQVNGVPPRPLGRTESRKLDAQSVGAGFDLGDARWESTLSHIRYEDRLDRRTGDDVAKRIESLALRSVLSWPVGAATLSLGLDAQRDDARLTTAGWEELCDYFGVHCRFTFVGTERSRQATFGYLAPYAGLRLPLSDAISVDAGLRLMSDWSLDETHLEPRVGIEWRASDPLLLFARAGVQHRFPDPFRRLLNPAGTSADRADSSRQVDFGARWTPGDWRIQGELWYKGFRYGDLLGSSFAADLEGESYGADLLIAKPFGRSFDGWLSISHTINERRLHGSGREVIPRFDVPWSGALALTWRPARGWSFGGKLRLQSGVRYTPLLWVGIDPSTDFPVALFGEPFSKRAPHYARLDLRVEKDFRLSFGEARVYLDLINVFDHYNTGAINRSLLDAYPTENGYSIRSFEYEGAPRIFALGAGISF